MNKITRQKRDVSRAVLQIICFHFIQPITKRRYKATFMNIQSQGKHGGPSVKRKILRSLYTFNFVPWSFSTSLVVLTRQGIVQPSQSLTLVVFEVSPVANVSSLNNFICMWKFLVVGCDAKPKIRPCTKHLLSFGRADDEVVAILLCLGQVLRFTEGRGLVLELEAHRMQLIVRCVKLQVGRVVYA